MFVCGDRRALEDQVLLIQKDILDGKIKSVKAIRQEINETKKVFKQAAKVVAKDKNLQAALIDLQQANKRLKDHMKDYCKKYPDSC